MKNQLTPTIGGSANIPGKLHGTLPANSSSSLLSRLFVCALFVVLLGVTIPKASGQIYNLSNGNSALSVNDGSSAGMYSYTVDGAPQDQQQWFWYRAGTMTSQMSINTIGTVSAVQSDARDLSLTYTGSQYTAKVVYSLTGGSAGSGQSGLNETITFVNTSSSSSLSLAFFDYNNFELGGVPSGQSLQFNTTAIPPPPHYNSFTQMAGSLSLTEQVTGGIGGGSPANVNPSHIEAAPYNQTLTELNSGSAVTLDDNPSVSGNVTGTFEWDVNLAPGTSLTISSLINITSVPEPSSMVLLALGLVAATALGRRCKRNLSGLNSNN